MLITRRLAVPLESALSLLTVLASSQTGRLLYLVCFQEEGLGERELLAGEEMFKVLTEDGLSTVNSLNDYWLN